MKCENGMDMPCECHGGRMKMAEGGEAEEMPPDMDAGADDDSLMDSCAEEAMKAMETKDKKGFLDAIRAIVMSCQE